MKKIFILICVLLVNSIFLFSYEEGPKYKLCRGYEHARTLYYTGISASLTSEGVTSIGFGWSRIDCCKLSTPMNWCDFNMAHNLCKYAIVQPEPTTCISGSAIGGNAPVDEEEMSDESHFEEFN